MNYKLNRECPKCGEYENISTEKRPDGDSICGECDFKDKTLYFDSYELTEVVTTRDLILNTLSDCVADFVYYDRKEDEDLKRADILRALDKEIVTIDMIVEHFKEKLEEGLE